MTYKYIKQTKCYISCFLFYLYLSSKEYLKGVKNIEQKISHMLHDSREIDDMTLSFSLFFIIRRKTIKALSLLYICQNETHKDFKLKI